MYAGPDYCKTLETIGSVPYGSGRVYVRVSESNGIVGWHVVDADGIELDGDWSGMTREEATGAAVEALKDWG